MVNAIVLAGGNKRFSFKEFLGQIEEFFYYREIYFRRTYKSVRPIKGSIKGKRTKRPMVEYIISTLQNMPEIEKIVSIGPKQEIEDALENRLKQYDKCEIIEQTDSFGGNVKKAYEAAGNKPSLFVTADSPTTKEDSIREFLSICNKLKEEYQIISPVVSERILKPYEKLFHRPYLKVILDDIYPEDYSNKKREGVRITSMTWADLGNLNKEKIDEAYSLRKLLKKSTRDKVRKIFGTEVFREYLGRKLNLSKIEKKISEYFGINTKVVGLSKADSSLDVDSTRDESNMIRIMSL